MQEMTVDVDQRSAIFTLLDQMGIPEFVVEGFCHDAVFLANKSITGTAQQRRLRREDPECQKGAEYSTEAR